MLPVNIDVSGTQGVAYSSSKLKIIVGIYSMILSINNLTKKYDHKNILNDLSLEIKSQEIYGLLGANGAGKTTTINIICGLLNYDSGSILINGKKINHQTKYLLGIATQENLLYSQLTCAENLAFFGKIYGLTGTKLKHAIYYCLESVKLLDYKDEIVANLSGGMQRRLNIALALVHSPQLLILDEPTTGLDIEIRYDIWQLIWRLKQQGISILLTTHLLDEAEKLCDRIGIMKQGKIFQEGSLNELKKIVPAQELIFVKTDDEEKIIQQGKKLGWQHRYYQDELAFLISDNIGLQDVINYFQDINLFSLRKETVNLQHIYLEILQNHN
jgi:ABC-2 type transport system ATP-binding protein